MSTPRAPLLRICHFEHQFLQLQPYLCYHDEVCCKEGCCTRHDHKYFNSWQFWYKIYIVLGLVIFLFLYRYICWCCRKKHQENIRTVEEEIDSHIVNLTMQTRNGEWPGTNFAPIAGVPKNDSVEPPPRYSIAIHLPKPANCDEVPTYEQATAMK